MLVTIEHIMVLEVVIFLFSGYIIVLEWKKVGNILKVTSTSLLDGLDVN